MENQFKKQSWFVILLLAIITGGIYMPFWYKKIKKSISELGTNGLMTGYIFVAIFTLIFNFSFNLSMTSGGESSRIYFSTNYYHIGDIFRFLYFLLHLFLAFSLRTILKNKFNTSSNPILTFLFGPLYLQTRINHIIESKPVVDVPPSVPNQPQV